MSTTLNDPSSLDPDFDSWWTTERRQSFEKYFSCPHLLVVSGYLDLILKYWIHYEIAQDYIKENPGWVDSGGHDYVSSQLTEEKIPKDNYLHKVPSLLKEKLLIKPASLLWASNQWSHLSGKLFLETDHGLDTISLESFQSNDLGVMTELYFRLVDDGYNSTQIKRDFPNIFTSRVRSRELNKLPLGISQAVSRLKSREIQISQPLKVDSNYFIINVLDYKQSTLDDQMRMKLMGILLVAWVDMVAAKIMSNYLEKRIVGESST